MPRPAPFIGILPDGRRPVNATPWQENESGDIVKRVERGELQPDKRHILELRLN
jgi:hypothetical protein